MKLHAQTLSSFTVYDYSKNAISDRLTYIECCDLIKSYPHIDFDEQGLRRWDIHQILSEAQTLSRKDLIERIETHLLNEFSVYFVTCLVTHYEDKPSLETHGFISNNILTYLHPETQEIVYENYDLDWPQRYPGIKITSITDQKPSTIAPILNQALPPKK